MFDSITDDGSAEEIPMAPLIDIVFLLLIFFLVVSTMQKPERELPLQLPESAAAITVTGVDEPFVVGIDAVGQPYLDGEPVSLELLRQRVREVATEEPDRRVRIDGDATTDFQQVVHVMDLLQFEGLRNVGVHVAGDGRFDGRK